MSPLMEASASLTRKYSELPRRSPLKLTIASIISYMTKQALPAVSTLTTDKLEEFKTADKVVLVAYIDKDDKTSNTTFSDVANSLRDDYLFGAISDADVAKAEGVSQPAIVLYKNFDEGKDTFTDKFDKDAIKKFVKTAATPLVGEVAPETYQSYMDVRNEAKARLCADANVIIGRSSARLHLRRHPRGAQRARCDAQARRREEQGCFELCHHRRQGFRRSCWQSQSRG